MQVQTLAAHPMLANEVFAICDVVPELQIRVAGIITKSMEEKLVSKFPNRPRTNNAWRAMWLALVAGMRALKSGERSWVVWMGLLSALLVAGFWVFMIVGELLFPH